MRILVMFSNTNRNAVLATGTEDRVIQSSLTTSIDNGRIQLKLVHDATFEDLRTEVLNRPYDIIQFSCHGEDRNLRLRDENGELQLVDSYMIKRILHDISGLQCLILNACCARTVGTDLTAMIPFVISMDGHPTDLAAIEFSRGFYGAINRGVSIEDAFYEGKSSIDANPGTRMFKDTPLLDIQREPTRKITNEWAVREAQQTTGFLDMMKNIRDFLERKICENTGTAPDLVMTLYARSFPDNTGVGSFEYDLIYYYNLRDPAPMFGPIVTRDERTAISQKAEESSVQYPDRSKIKPGGFVERENIFCSSWIKINSLNSVKGLLFINSRQQVDPISQSPLLPAYFQDALFKTYLANLGIALGSIINNRHTRIDTRHMQIINLYNNKPFFGLKSKTVLTHHDIQLFFTTIEAALKRIFGETPIAVSFYAYKKESKYLQWLWSNGSTSIRAFTSMNNFKQNPENAPLPVQVLLDPTHKPLLIHELQYSQRYKQIAVRTQLKDTANSNLVVPILSNKESGELVGIIDIQAASKYEFGTDDVQLLYEFNTHFVSDFIEKIMTGALPAEQRDLLSSDIYYKPFSSTPLSFAAKELLELNFNPMKYLFHWENIRRLCVGQPVEFPSLIEIWPSMKCNHQCTWCRTKPDQLDFANSAAFMDSHLLHSLAEQLVAAKNGLFDILISGGGEPLYHPEIHYFMETLKSFKGNVGIFTNGKRPSDFRFWEYFFAEQTKHRFARISFNAATPGAYYQLHFSVTKKRRAATFTRQYSEARKIVMDLLGLRSKKSTIALGTTVHSQWIDTVPEQIEHAKALGVDFLQMRPELFESSRNPSKGEELKEQVKKYHTDSFPVIYTDSERAFKNHDYDVCYAMFLVPAIVPSVHPDEVLVFPCSYTNTHANEKNILGAMKSGASMADFWGELHQQINNGTSENSNQITILRKNLINPIKDHCPQCRYYMLNKRIIAIKEHQDKIYLINELLEKLTINPNNEINDELVKEIRGTWNDDVINIELAQRAFQISARLGIKPSL